MFCLAEKESKVFIEIEKDRETFTRFCFFVTKLIPEGLLLGRLAC